LRDLRQTPAADRGALLALATSYVSAIAAPDKSTTTPAISAAFAAAATADLETTLGAADWVVAGATQFGRVQRVEIRSGTVTSVDGTVVDVLGGKLPAAATGVLELRGRLGGMLAEVPATITPGPGGLQFHADLELNRLGRRLLTPRTGPEVRMELRLAGVRVPLIARDADLPAEDVRVPTRWAPVTGDRLRFRERNGRFVAELSALPAISDAAIDFTGRARNAIRRVRLPDGQTSRSESDS